MVDYRFGDCCGIQEVLVNEEPEYVFEYEKTAQELADKVDGDVVELHHTNLTHLWNATDSDFEFIGYGVINNEGELL